MTQPIKTGDWQNTDTENDRGRTQYQSRVRTRTHRDLGARLSVHQDRPPFGEGETIAKGIVVFYDREKRDEVVGLSIRCAPVVLEPLVDAVLAEHGLAPAQQVPAGP